MSKKNEDFNKEDGNAILEEIYGKIENNKEDVKEICEEEVSQKKICDEDSDEENNRIFKDKLKKHKNFDKRGQKFNKSKNRNYGNKRYETFNND